MALNSGWNQRPNRRLSRRRVLPFAALAAGTILLIGIAVVVWRTEPIPIRPDDPMQVARGELTYSRRCANCHGTNLQGEPGWPARKSNGHSFAPPLDESGHAANHSDAELRNFVADGIRGSDMPAFRSILSNPEIAAVRAFIKNRWPDDIRTHQERLSE